MPGSRNVGTITSFDASGMQRPDVTGINSVGRWSACMIQPAGSATLSIEMSNAAERKPCHGRGRESGHLDDDGLAVGGVAHPDVAEQRAGGRHAVGGARQAGAVGKGVLQLRCTSALQPAHTHSCGLTPACSTWFGQLEGDTGPHGSRQLHRVSSVFALGRACCTLRSSGQQ